MCVVKRIKLTTTKKLQLKSTGPSTVFGSFLAATLDSTPSISKPVVEYNPGPSVPFGAWGPMNACAASIELVGCEAYGALELEATFEEPLKALLDEA